jgi:chemotaxis methyl-accepting protein methylase
MRRLGCESSVAYAGLLHDNPSECERLIEALTINVSCFFRNPVVFEILADTVLPDMIERKRRAGSNEIRVWSAGCAAGEEPYSVAIQIHQALKSELGNWTIHIFATDVDGDVLRRADAATYPREELKNVKLGVLDKYFRGGDNRFEVRRFIRKMVRFSQDNLISPKTIAPAESVFGTFDLVLCRNVLIFLSREVQDRVLGKLYGSLSRGGCLVLGEAGSLNDELGGKMEVVDSGNKIYRKSR